MKVIKVADGIWSIINNDEEIASIETHWRFNKSDAKVLYIGEKEICAVKNQKEALEKLKEILTQK